MNLQDIKHDGKITWMDVIRAFGDIVITQSYHAMYYALYRKDGQFGYVAVPCDYRATLNYTDDDWQVTLDTMEENLVWGSPKDIFEYIMGQETHTQESLVIAQYMYGVHIYNTDGVILANWIYGNGSNKSSYDPIIYMLGDVLVREDTPDWQGDTFVLLWDNNTELYGYLEFGWGSCSGCDALQGCDGDNEALGELIARLASSVRWGKNTDLIEFFTGDVFKGQWSWWSELAMQFALKAVAYLSDDDNLDELQWQQQFNESPEELHRCILRREKNTMTV